MRIDGTNDLTAKPTLDTTAKTAKAKITDGLNSTDSNAQVLSTYLPNVRKAQAAEEVNAQAIAEARKMLADGTLDTTERINLAAETLVLIGV